MLGNESSDLSVHCPATTAAADADPTESSFEFWTEFAALLAVAAFGLVCNTLAVPILLTRQVSSSLFNRTLVFLAAFDNVYLLCEMTESVRQYLGPAAGEWHVQLFPISSTPCRYFSFPAAAANYGLGAFGAAVCEINFAQLTGSSEIGK